MQSAAVDAIILPTAEVQSRALPRYASRYHKNNEVDLEVIFYDEAMTSFRVKREGYIPRGYMSVWVGRP